MNYGYVGGYLQYYVFMLPGLILALWASAKVKRTFAKYSSVSNLRGLTGRDAAMLVLQNNGVTGVSIERVSGQLTDHFDPKTNVIRLSDSVYSSCSVAAVGVAAHEAGHAVQHAIGYAPIKVRNSIVPVCNIGSQLSVPLIIIGTLLLSDALVMVGVALFAITVLFHLVTLPVEFNASRRALAAIKSADLLDKNEFGGARSVLTAAAMTYVASFLQSLLSLLYFLLRTNRRK